MPSAGGLATGLREPHRKSGGVWIGWPGQTMPDDVAQRSSIEHELQASGMMPVWLTEAEVARYYETMSNGVIWPLFHYLPEQIPLHVRHWDAYEAVNARFADAVAEIHEPGDRIWVHDYQLMRLPALIRERIPDARIGFFLHIPFPVTELFAMLPAREAVLRGLLGADLIGFHTAGYARHFADAAARLLGARVTGSSIEFEGRTSRTGVFPMGVDAKALGERAATPEADEEIRQLVAGAEDVELFVGIDRLDYTKGIPRRLLSFERLLADHPELHERVRLIQVAVPSRTSVPAYRKFRQHVDAIVGRINGEFGTARWVPVHYLYRGLPEPQVLALYRAARVVLVTPLRDGMNLVAKEFVATRADEDGVLVLSEFVGAADELTDALFVNPHDVDGSAAVYHRALVMQREERRARMRGMRAHVLEYDVHFWAESFLAALDAAGDPPAPRTGTRTRRKRRAT